MDTDFPADVRGDSSRLATCNGVLGIDQFNIFPLDYSLLPEYDVAKSKQWVSFRSNPLFAFSRKLHALYRVYRPWNYGHT